MKYIQLTSVTNFLLFLRYLSKDPRGNSSMTSPRGCRINPNSCTTKLESTKKNLSIKSRNRPFS